MILQLVHIIASFSGSDNNDDDGGSDGGGVIERSMELREKHNHNYNQIQN